MGELFIKKQKRGAKLGLPPRIACQVWYVRTFLVKAPTCVTSYMNSHIT